MNDSDSSQQYDSEFGLVEVWSENRVMNRYEDAVRYESVYGTTVEIRREARGLWGIVIDGQRIVTRDSCSHACATAAWIAPPRKEKPTG
jgi:hypothetical protein